MYMSVSFSPEMDSPAVMLKDVGIESSIHVTKWMNVHSFGLCFC